MYISMLQLALNCKICQILSNILISSLFHHKFCVLLSMLQLSDLIQLSPSDVDRLLCSRAEMEKYFIFPSSFNIEPLLQVTCGLNSTVLLAEFNHVFAVNQLTMEVMSTFFIAMTSEVHVHVYHIIHTERSYV